MQTQTNFRYIVVFSIEAVEKWFLEQDEKVQALFTRVIDYFEEFGGQRTSNIPRSKIKKVHGKIWEIRIEQNTNIYRLFYAWDSHTCVILHGFQKRSVKTPKNEINIANQRLKSYEARQLELKSIKIR